MIDEDIVFKWRNNDCRQIVAGEFDGEIEQTVAEGDGPVNALDGALRKAL